MSTEPITGQTYQEAGSLQTDALQNAMLNYFAAWTNCVVLSIGDNAPPGSPLNGDRYIVGDTPTGAWASHAGELAVYRDAWQFYPALEGVAVHNLDDGADWIYEGSGSWAVKAGGGGGDAADIDYDNSTSGLTATNVQDAIDEVAAGGGGGGSGDMIKVAEVVVTGSAVTDIDFSSLNLDSHGIYQIEAFIVPGATGTHAIALYYNGDTTDANYSSQYFTADAATQAFGRGALPYVMHAVSISGTSLPIAFTCTIRKAAGVRPVAQTPPSPSVYGSNIAMVARATGWNSTANVTSMKLRNSTSSGFGVGSFFRLYRLN